jgi:hypothetical protein
MQSRGFPSSRPHDRLAWLWLAIGASLLPFAMVQTVWPITAWLAPVFLLRFSRTQRPALGLPLLWLALCLGFAIGWRDDFIPLPVGIPGPQAGLLRGSLVVFSAALGVLPYVLDRLIAARLGEPCGRMSSRAVAVSSRREVVEGLRWVCHQPLVASCRCCTAASTCVASATR